MSSPNSAQDWHLLNLRESFDERRFTEWTHLYDETFADGDTHEDASQWRGWYGVDEVSWNPATNNGSVPLTTVLAVDHDAAGGALLGGINIEFYRSSGCALITYIAVKPAARQRGIGKNLLQAACLAARQLADSLGARLKGVLFETYRPVRSASESREDRVKRLFVLDRLGGRRIAFEEPGYRQPPLAPGQKPSSDLYLCHFPQYASAHSLDKETLQAFFHEFALALTGNPGEAAAIGLPLMNTACPADGGRGDLVLDEPLLFLESRHLEIRQFAIALHLAEEEEDADPCATGGANTSGSDDGMPASCPAYRTWEHDLTAHAYLDRKPFSSSCFHLPEGITGLEIIFPRQFEFSSEGREESLFTLSRNEETRRFRLGISRTRFRRSGGAIWHLTLRNWPGESVHEFDLIKIIQLYEGYESDGTHMNRFKYAFLDSSGNRITKLPGLSATGDCTGFESLVELLDGLLRPARREIDGGACPLRPRICGGTLQILAPDGPQRSVFEQIIRLARTARPGSDDASATEELEELFESSELMRNALLSTCGIVQGILDFNEIDSSEVADILDPTLPELSSLHRIHRSTYTCIDETDRAFNACESTIHISPYLILPHSILLHDELLLQRSSVCITAAIEKLGGTRIPGLLHKTEVLLAAKDMVRRAGILLDRLPQPNPFNYFTEREFLNRAIENHGFEPRLQAERTRLREVAGQIRTIEEARRAKDRSRLFLLLSLLAIISAGEFMSQAAQAIVAAAGDGNAENFGESMVTLVVTALIGLLAVTFYLLHRRTPGDDLE